MPNDNSGFSFRIRIVIFTLFILSGLFFCSSYFLVNTNPEISHAMKDASIAVFATTLVALIYEWALREEFRKMLKKDTDRLAIDFNSSVDKKVEELLKKFSSSMDEGIKNKFEKIFIDIVGELRNSLEKERETYISLTKEELKKTINDSMPGHYRRLREHGIIDVYKSINTDLNVKFCQKFLRLRELK